MSWNLGWRPGTSCTSFLYQFSSLVLRENLLVLLQGLIRILLLMMRVVAGVIGRRWAELTVFLSHDKLLSKRQLSFALYLGRWVEGERVDSSVRQTLKLIHADSFSFLLAKPHLSCDRKVWPAWLWQYRATFVIVVVPGKWQGCQLFDRFLRLNW